MNWEATKVWFYSFAAASFTAWEKADKVAVIVALLACAIAYITFRSQREHNRKSVLPLPEVWLSDLSSEIQISLMNHGAGPLIIESFRVFRNGKDKFDSVFKATTLEGAEWFVDNIDRRPIRSSGSIKLLHFLADPTETGRDIQKLALELSVVKVELTYTDVYGSKFPTYSRDLAWFDR